MLDREKYMKKIFSFIGSEKKGDSNTFKYANMILEYVRVNYTGSLEIEIVVAGSAEITKCKECKNCFKTGKCFLDDNDYMYEIKDKMLKADVIILGCGVYFQHVSSEMKNYIDRLAYWAHTFSLAGKQCVLLSTSGSNGNEFVLSYMQRVSMSLGMQVIGTSYCMVEYPAELGDDILLEERIKLISDMIVRALNGEIKKKSNDFQEKLFQSMKEIYSTHPEFKNEIYIWKKRGLFECHNFNDVMNL